MRVVLVAFLLAACGPSSSTPGAPTASAPSAAPGTTRQEVMSSSPMPTLSFAVDPSAEWPVVIYEAEGSIIRERTASSTREVARSCGQPVRLESRAAGLLEWCRTALDSDELRLVSLPDGKVTVLASGTTASWPADLSPDGRSVAAFRLGDCPTPAPVCQTRAVLIDAASKTERELLPSGYHLGARLEWTALGLTLFQPQCAEAGCTGPGDRSGTFVWDGSAFKKWSELRFVATSGDWTLLERLTSFGREPRAVVIRGPQGEKELSAGHALTISATGETLVWDPGQRLLTRLAPDGRVLWQAGFDGAVLKMIGPDALLATSPASKIELYDLKRMLRFAPTTPIPYAVAGVAR